MAGEPVLFIVNPASGGGKTARDWAAIESWLPSTGIPYETALTSGPMDAMRIAESAVRQSRPVVVAVGGDGTLNEVVNGFFHNGAPIPTTSRMAMVPLGTGGDFRRTLHIPLDPRKAVDILKTGVPRRLDVGCVTYQGNDGNTQVRHFINIADAGYGGDVVHRVNAGKKRSGGMTFTLTALMLLLAYKNKPMRVIIDGEAHDVVAQQVVVANCQYFGGGMRMAPNALPTDGVFDVIVIGDAGKIESIRGMAQIRDGKHLDEHNPKITVMYGKRVEVTSPKQVRIDIDGEDPGMLPALFEIQPGSIEFLTPRAVA
ncbi:MAG TPA: diacylglycerol kinase family protein [Candidatus Dormibacteraeota bacterium]|nr:diacylglycerol kinase family protein [Candidatus Dormibacteraeota bacterium]